MHTIDNSRIPPRRLNPTPRNPSAFTLMEILVVVMILGILAAIVVPQLASASTDAQAAAALNITKSVQEQINLRHAQTGVWPATINPAWFTDGALPNGPFDPAITGSVYYDTSGDPNKTRPTVKDTNNPTLKAFWYNPLNGQFHARVTGQATNAQTLALYNLTNRASLTSIDQITD